MAKVVQPKASGGHASTTDGYWDLVAAEVLTIAMPNNIKSIAFSTTGSGSGATMTITLT